MEYMRVNAEKELKIEEIKLEYGKKKEERLAEMRQERA